MISPQYKSTGEKYRAEDTSQRGGRTWYPVELQQIATRLFAWAVGHLLRKYVSRRSADSGEFNWNQAGGPRCPANFVAETEGSA